MSVLEIPASPGQRRLWALVSDTAGEPTYQLIWYSVNEGPLDVGALGAAIRALIDRHEALRTDFGFTGGALHQRVQHPPAEVPLEFTELHADSADELAAAFDAELTRFASIAFDLERAPLARFRLIRRPRLGEPGQVYDTLAIAVHHVVLDAWSALILKVELAAFYSAFRAGTELRLDPVRVQCADLCAWLASQRDDTRCQEDLEFWRAELAGLAELDLTHGRRRPASPSHCGGRIDVSIEPQFADQIRQFARNRHASAFMVLHAAFAAALSRIFGGTDIAVGTNVSERTSSETVNTVGMFVDRIVLRVDLGGDPTFGELVDRVKDVVLATHDHTAPGFDQIVSAIAPKRVPGLMPLAQASINLQPAITDRWPESQVELWRQRGRVSDDPFRLNPVDGTQYYATVLHDLGLDLRDLAGFDGMLEYRDGVVTQDDARRVWSLMRRILLAGLAEPDRPVAAVPSLETADLNALLASHDGGSASAPGERLVLDLVRRWVISCPDEVAVDSDDGILTYRQLAARADALASRLRACGVRAEVPVLVAVERSTALTVALLGVLAAGGAYVPVDLQAPTAYLAQAAATVGARVLVTGPAQQAGQAVLPPMTVVAVSDDAKTAAGSVPLARPGCTDPASAAYVLFTSGSTGQPKAVTVEHRNLAAYLTGFLEVTGPPPGAVHLLIQNPTFDASLTTICGALASGGVLRIVTADTAADPGELSARLSGSPADYLKATPSHLTALLAGADAGRLAALRPRRALILGGEPVPAALARLVTDAGWHLINQYGPTETTIGVLVGHMAEVDGDPAQGWLGRPLPGVRAYVLDERGAHVPPGCVGELCIGGELVSRGYAGAPAATAMTFCPDPHAGAGGARMYRTGDLVRCHGDGTFTFCGRRDRQVKIRGFRIEPSSIEAVLGAQPGVAHAVVVARGEHGRERLIGYIVPAAGQAGVADQASLIAALAERLPEYALPTALVAVDELPLTPGGKLDVGALPDPVAQERSPGKVDGTCKADDASQAAGAEPVTPTELRLAGIWRSVLRREGISVTDDFFDLGGDSILAVQAVGEARAEGIKLTMRGLIRNRTIRAIAASLPLDTDTSSRAVEGDGAASVLPDLAGVTRIGVDRDKIAGDFGARLAAYTDPASGLIELEAGQDQLFLIADSGRCDDWTTGALATALIDPLAPLPQLLPGGPPVRPAGRGQAVEVRDVASWENTSRLARAVMPPVVREGLAGPAHDPYGTDLRDLVVAAVTRALSLLDQPRPCWLLVCDVDKHGRAGRIAGASPRPGRVGVVAEPSASPDALVQAAKAAVKDAVPEPVTAGEPGDVPTAVRVLDLPPGAALISATMPEDRQLVFIAGGDILVTTTGLDARRLAGAVLDALTWIAEHCASQAPVYSRADFPAADLSQAELDRLVAALNLASEDGASL